MSPEQIAVVADSLNRAYHASKGDEAQAATTPLPTWLLQALDESLKDVGEAVVPSDEEVAAQHAALRAQIEAEVRASLAPADSTQMAPVVGLMPVRYVGRRDSYRDGAYGTHLVFQQGQTRMVPSAKAKLMLRHADVYELGEVAAATAAVIVGEGSKATQADEEARIHELRDSVQNMTKAAVAEYVKTNFRVDLNPNTMKVDEMRQKAVQLIDQYGAP